MRLRDLLRTYGPLLLVLGLLYLLFRVALDFAFPFVLALAIAILIDPLVDRLERRARLPRGLAVGIVLVLLAVVLLLFLVVGVARIAAELEVLAAGVPAYYRQFDEDVARLWDRYGEWLSTLPPALQQQLDMRQQEWVRGASRALDSLARSLQALVLEGLPNLFVIILISLIATFFISRDRQVVRDFILYLVPAPWRASVQRLMRRLLDSLVGFANAMVILVVLTTIVTTLGLMLIDAPFALLLGVTSGLLDAIPIVGPALLFVPWIAYHVLFGSVGFGLKLLLVYGVITGLRVVAQAQVIGNRMGLHPLTTLVSLYLGLRLFGTVGVLIGPLSAVIIKAMLETGMLPLDGRGGGGSS